MGIELLAQSLSKNSTLEVLNISSLPTKKYNTNMFSDVFSIFMPNNSEAIAEIIANSTLKILYLNGLQCLCNLHLTFKETTSATKHVDTFRKPSRRILHYNDFTLVVESCDFVFFTIQGNNLGPVGAEQLIFGLMQNTSLKCLDISGNSIKDIGGNNFLNLVSRKTTLAWLDISGCLLVAKLSSNRC